METVTRLGKATLGKADSRLQSWTIALGVNIKELVTEARTLLPPETSLLCVHRGTPAYTLLLVGKTQYPHSYGYVKGVIQTHYSLGCVSKPSDCHCGDRVEG